MNLPAGTNLDSAEEVTSTSTGSIRGLARANLPEVWSAVDLKALTYTSWASPGICSQDVDAILRSAKINNALDGITGVLIFNGTAFMQVLEGAKAGVDDLFKRLACDRRHTNIRVRHERMIAERTFPDWSMAYLRLEDGTFDGEEAVRRALERDLPSGTLNLIKGMTHAVENGQ